jgi:PGF-CTERM protein
MYVPDSLVAVLAALLVASVVVPAAAMAATPESVVATQQSAGTDSLTCGFSRSATADEGTNPNVSITTWVAPGSAYGELENASAIAAATDAERVTPLGDDEPTVATTDTAVHRIELNGSAVGFLDRLAAQERGSPTENFRHLVREEGIEFRYIGPSACPPRLALNETVERGSLRVVADRENETLYVLLDVDEAVYQRPGSSSGADDWDWGHHAISLELERSSGLVAESVTAESHYDAEDSQVTFAAETEGLVRASAKSNQTVRGHTSVAPGTEIRVQLRPVEAPTGRLNATTTANLSKGFDAEFDLSDVGDALYTVQVVGMGRDEDFRRTTLVAVGNASGAAVYAGTPESEGLALDDLSVATTHGGFAVVRNASGGIVGVSEYLDPGSASPRPDLRPPIRSSQTVTVTLYRDANGNRTFDSADEPYRANGSVVSDTTNVTIEGEPPEVPTTGTTTTLEIPETRTATATTSTPATETKTKVFTDTTATTTTPSTVPGFGAVGTVVALLASLAVLRWRR